MYPVFAVCTLNNVNITILCAHGARKFSHDDTAVMILINSISKSALFIHMPIFFLKNVFTLLMTNV